MVTFQLTEAQEGQVRKFLTPFKEYAKSSRYQDDLRDREQREGYFRSLTRERIVDMDQVELEKLVTVLWATQMWGNKHYLAQTIIAKNGMERLRSELAELLHGEAQPARRYERFLKNVSGLGPASITEILCHAFPEECGTWNDRARKGLDLLGLGSVVPVGKYRLNAEEYGRFNEVGKAIAQELAGAGFADADLMFVDYFLFEVSEEGERPTGQPVRAVTGVEFDHDEARDQIRDIGQWLGFDAETEVPVARGARVDVVWRAKIANLGAVTYVFEVHKSGSIDGLILNLQKSLNNPTVQKVVAVSDERRLEETRKEADGLPEAFRKALALWPVSEIARAHDNLRQASEIIGRLELVREAFPALQ